MHFKILEAFPPALGGGDGTDFKLHARQECLVQGTTLNLLRRQSCKNYSSLV